MKKQADTARLAAANEARPRVEVYHKTWCSYSCAARAPFILRVTSRIFTVAGIATVFLAVIQIAVAVHSTIIEF